MPIDEHNRAVRPDKLLTEEEVRAEDTRRAKEFGSALKQLGQRLLDHPEDHFAVLLMAQQLAVAGWVPKSWPETYKWFSAEVSCR